MLHEVRLMSMYTEFLIKVDSKNNDTLWPICNVVHCSMKRQTVGGNTPNFFKFITSSVLNAEH